VGVAGNPHIAVLFRVPTEYGKIYKKWSISILEKSGKQFFWPVSCGNTKEFFIHVLLTCIFIIVYSLLAFLLSYC